MNEQISSEEIFPEYNRDKDIETLTNIYVTISVPVDLLAYTRAFDVLYNKYLHSLEQSESPKPTRAEVYRKLLTLRKRGQLPRLFRPPSLFANEEGGES